MQAVDNEIETIHLYVVREDDRRPQTLLPVILSVLCFLGIVAVTVYSGDHPYYEHQTIRVPAIFLPIQTLIATVPIVRTGVKTYGATTAHGVLTVYNGSIITQEIPAGMIVTSANGVEVVVEDDVTVPAGNPPYYGIASVSAYAVVSGIQGNIAALSINNVYGTSLYIRNLHAFKGGKNSYSIPVATAQDRQNALDSARAILITQQAKIHDFLTYPCNETTQEKHGILELSWSCHYVTYSVPSYMKVTAVRLVGKTLFVDVVFVPRPRIIQFK